MSAQPSAATRACLWAAAAVPVLYFGAQIAAAPFFPGYRFLTDSASLLGSDRSTLPQILNTGAFLTGVAALAAAYGVFQGLRALGSRSVWSWLVALSIVSTGVSSIWASIFHLPDPRHNPGALGAGTFLGPLAFLLAFWSLRCARHLRIYLAINLAAIAVLVPIMAGLTGVDLQRYGGLLQRCVAAVFYVPIGVIGWFLLRQGRRC